MLFRTLFTNNYILYVYVLLVPIDYKSNLWNSFFIQDRCLNHYESIWELQISTFSLLHHQH